MGSAIIVALPGWSKVVFSSGAVAWGDDVPVIKVTAKREKNGITPEECREMGMSQDECSGMILNGTRNRDGNCEGTHPGGMWVATP